MKNEEKLFYILNELTQYVEDNSNSTESIVDAINDLTNEVKKHNELSEKRNIYLKQIVNHTGV